VVADHIDAVARKLEKLAPVGEKKRVIEEALEEVQTLFQNGRSTSG